MEREILFRGKRLDNGARGAWVEGSLCVEHYPSFEGRPERWECSISVPKVEAPWHSSVYSVDPATVGQYTGLTDKNGKKIFEGDLLEYLDYDDPPYLVYWGDGGWNTKSGDSMPDDMTSFDSDRWEIIGNKWDTPELLEVKK